MGKITLYFLCFVALAMWVLLTWLVNPPRLRAVASRDRQRVLVTFRLSRSKRPVQVCEVALPRAWAGATGAAPPPGFREELLERTFIRGGERDPETFNRDMLRWVGELNVPPGREVTLAIPIAHRATENSTLVFRFTRNDKIGSLNEACRVTVSADIAAPPPVRVSERA